MAQKNHKSPNGSGSTDVNGSKAVDSETTMSLFGTMLVKKPLESNVSRKRSKVGFQWFCYLYSALVAITVIIWSSCDSQPQAQDLDPDLTDVQKFLRDFVCHAPGGYCHPSLMSSERGHVANRPIAENALVLRVPRSLQLLDVDALRDPFVKRELLGARHKSTGNPLDHGAFMAAYMAIRNKTLASNDPLGPFFHMLPGYNDVFELAPNDPLASYLHMLPSYEDLFEFHPALWSPKDLMDLGPRSFSFAMAKLYQDMLTSEYMAFANVSQHFASQISKKEYKAMRVNVLSRAFGGKIVAGKDKLRDDEFEFYRTKAGIDFRKENHKVMVPVLDMYNHHAKPNVKWAQDTGSSSKGEFVVRASKGGISAGHEVVVSYGQHSEASLFAKCGFVGGDGSDFTKASIAAQHQPKDLGTALFSYLPWARELDESALITTKREMLRYLQFDDGYQDCIEPDKHPEAFELKRLKLEHLVRIAHTPDRWFYYVPPRNEASRPAKTTAEPITIEPPRFKRLSQGYQVGNLVPTCRLIALHHKDYKGEAIHILKEGLKNGDEINLEPGGDELEYRTNRCLVRLTGLQLLKYDTRPDMKKEENKVRLLNEFSYRSRSWTFANVRLGEMQTLDLVRQVALTGAHNEARRIKERLKATSDDILPTFRTRTCPMEYSSSLLD